VLCALIDQSALNREIGGPAVMRDQLAHLAVMSVPGSLSTVTVPAGSNAAKMKSCQLSDMLRAAAP